VSNPGCFSIERRFNKQKVWKGPEEAAYEKWSRAKFRESTCLQEIGAFLGEPATCLDGATSGGVDGLLAEFGTENMMVYEQVALDDENVDVVG
jgi:hypothetical protein